MPFDFDEKSPGVIPSLCKEDGNSNLLLERGCVFSPEHIARLATRNNSVAFIVSVSLLRRNRRQMADA